jgi:hypothetical protein
VSLGRIHPSSVAAAAASGWKHEDTLVPSPSPVAEWLRPGQHVHRGLLLTVAARHVGGGDDRARGDTCGKGGGRGSHCCLLEAPSPAVWASGESPRSRKPSVATTSCPRKAWPGASGSSEAADQLSVAADATPRQHPMQGFLGTQSFREPQVWRTALPEGGWAGLPARRASRTRRVREDHMPDGDGPYLPISSSRWRGRAAKLLLPRQSRTPGGRMGSSGGRSPASWSSPRPPDAEERFGLRHRQTRAAVGEEQMSELRDLVAGNHRGPDQTAAFRRRNRQPFRARSRAGRPDFVQRSIRPRRAVGATSQFGLSRDP